MTNLGKNKVLENQTREVIYNVFLYFMSLKVGEVNVITEVKTQVAAATGVSVKSVERIVKEVKDATEDGQDPFSKKQERKRKRSSPLTNLEEFMYRDIRNIVYNFHITEGCRVTISNLRKKLNEELGWSGRDTSLRKILRKIGFRWRNTRNKRQVLIEGQRIRSLRISYLQKIKYYREQNRPVIYLDETYIHSGHTKSKSWSDNSNNGLFSNISKGPRLVIVHAGGAEGFIPNGLLIFKSGTRSGDYHDEMNGTNYEKWVKEKLLPNLPKNSMVVADNAPYHNAQVDPAPNSNSKKAEMIEWLTKHDIQFHHSMLKPQLYQLIKENKSQHIRYKFE